MKNHSRTKKVLVSTSLILIAVVVSFLFWVMSDDHHPLREYIMNQSHVENDNNSNHQEDTDQDDENVNAEPEPDPIPVPEPEPDEIVKLKVSAIGDIMFHSTQMQSHHFNKDSGKYEAKPFFEYVEPYFQDADLMIANFETTTGGADLGYTGYPQFNAPDEVIPTLKDIGIDVLITTNNHSLDTGDTGLKRTAQLMNKYKIDSVGTYEEKPDSRVLYKDVKGLKVAILAYTESTNGLGDQYDPVYLNSIINLMDEDIILADIEEAKENDADIIISYMHWGEEYANEPNETQVQLAEKMADAGVHIIFGSHPHVIQKSDMIETDSFNTFVIYSLGNFISNQRAETLGDDRRQTEDGVIVQLELEKNITQDELELTSVDYVPTWVYRNEIKDGQYDYRVVPIEDYLQDDLFKDITNRMQESLDATNAKLNTNTKK